MNWRTLDEILYDLTKLGLNENQLKAAANLVMEGHDTGKHMQAVKSVEIASNAK